MYLNKKHGNHGQVCCIIDSWRSLVAGGRPRRRRRPACGHRYASRDTQLVVMYLTVSCVCACFACRGRAGAGRRRRLAVVHRHHRVLAVRLGGGHRGLHRRLRVPQLTLPVRHVLPGRRRIHELQMLLLPVACLHCVCV
jgi:hypothetical protein